MKTQKQRSIANKDTASIGAKVDSELHSILKTTALDRGVSMSTVIEEAVKHYVVTVLGIDTNGG